VSALVIDEARDTLGGQHLGGVAIAAAVFCDSVHDDETGPCALGYDLIARKLRDHVR
jgi:hypothetical protein